jgi:serine protease Do
MILTADGWLISTADTFSNSKIKYSAVGYQNKQYNLSGLVSDPATGLTFVKAEGAVNLPVAKIVKSDDLTLGQTVVVVGGRDRILITSITKIGYQFTTSKELALNSDILSKRIYLDQQLDESYDGASLVNFKGEVIGIVSAGVVIPADYFSAVLAQVLNKQAISRAMLGVDYLDLSQVDGLINWGDRGAYVVNEPLRGSSAFGFVKKGDLIKKVNDFELNAFKGLAEAVNEFKSGDRVDLSLVRNKQDLVISVILK